MNFGILTPASQSELWGKGRWKNVFARYQEVFAPHILIPIPWDTLFSQQKLFPTLQAIFPLLAWGYHEKKEEWFEQLFLMEKNPELLLINSPKILRWNSHKSYLQDPLLHDQESGLRPIPTYFTPKLDEKSLERALEIFGEKMLMGGLVAKPAMSSAAKGTYHLKMENRGINKFEELEKIHNPNQEYLLQPFYPTIAGKEGEISLIYLGGEFSHAVRKNVGPIPGEFRIHLEYQGTRQKTLVQEKEIRGGGNILEKVAEKFDVKKLGYARVDIIQDPGNPNSYHIMELELIEPDLFVDFVSEETDLQLGLNRLINLTRQA